MKENWTYKKLGEVCDVKTGKLDANASDGNGLYPFFTCSKEPLRINTYSYDAECVLVAGNGDLNVKYYNGRFDAYQRTYIITLKNGITDISVRYLYCFFLLYVETLRKKSIGGVIKYIKLGDITEAKVYIPSLSEQSRIVSELDLLQSIIDKQQAQLKELDKLAQAVFYDMFGDPVENEKGWEVKTMGEVGELQRGSGLSKKDLIENGFPCMLYGQIHTRFGAYTKKHVACIPKELVKTAKIAHPGDVIMAITSEDVEGSCKSVAWMGDYDIAIGSDAAIYRHTMNGIYVSYYTQTKAFFNEKAKYAKGFKVTHISTKEIAAIPIPNPPLSLQQSFAAKIESIEKQKDAISQSIAETQKLFDYTMDKYFG